MRKLPLINRTITTFLSLVLILISIPVSAVMAQSPATAGFTISPSVFPIGHSSSALLCMSPLSTAGALTFDQNDVIGFQFDNSIGTVTAMDPAVLVHSSTLVPADFQTRQNPVNGYKLTITYINTNSKQFNYTDTICAKVTFTAGATVGSTLVRYSSKFTGQAGIVGNLPYLTIYTIDFPAGVPGPKGDKGDQGPQGVPGTSPDLTAVLTRLTNLEALTNGAGRAYVIDNPGGDLIPGRLSVIDTATNTVAATVPVGTNPQAVAINPAGTRLYVVNNISSNVSVIDTVANTVVTTVAVGGITAGVAINPAGARVYITSQNTNNISVIDTDTNTVVATVGVGVAPSSIAVNEAGSRVYVVNSSDKNVSVINAATNTVVATIPVGNSPFGVAVNPAGTRVYVANASDNTISVIDATTNTAGTPVTVGQHPQAVAVNPAGTRVYVANRGGNSVSVIDTATNSVVATVTVSSGPNGLAFNAAGTRVYVSAVSSGRVSVIDTTTNTVVATITGFNQVAGVAAR